MLTEVMEHYGLAREFHKAGYYETAHQRQLFKDIKAAIVAGKLVALTGVGVVLSMKQKTTLSSKALLCKGSSLHF